MYQKNLNWEIFHQLSGQTLQNCEDYERLRNCTNLEETADVKQNATKKQLDTGPKKNLYGTAAEIWIMPLD